MRRSKKSRPTWRPFQSDHGTFRKRWRTVSRASARTFISTLDTVRHHQTLDQETKRNVFQLRFLLEWDIRLLDSAAKTWRGSLLQQSLLSILGATHRCLASIRTLNGPLRGPVQVGVRLQAQVHHDRDEPGLVGVLPSNERSYGPAHNAQSPEQGGGCHCQSTSKSRSSRNEQNRFVFSLYAAADWVIVLAIPWPRGL
jgi:hypothetical protein